MDIKFKEDFIVLWKRFFGEAELPVTFYYTNEEGHAELVKPHTIRRCVIAALSLVSKGRAVCFDAESIDCSGGQQCLGFRETFEPEDEYFLSSGIPGKIEGERYLKTPQIAAEALKLMPSFKAPARFIVFKRWDALNELDEPDVVIFFACPDVLSGLFTLANFEEAEPNGVFTPWGSGCSSIVTYPFLEKDSIRPRAVIGMFDVSPRRFVPENTLSFAVPMCKFERMVNNMEESFLTTNSWKAVQKRIQEAL
ncbi:DUF169 domain-containing protein [Candidatus Bathyarchaeota archaeon]|nr:DUF169 domain-containing protein [Candidatus Bathyarchaeota archaeon]